MADMHTHVILSKKFGTVLVHVDEADAGLFGGLTWGAHFKRGKPHCISHQVGRSAILLHREIVKRVFPSTKMNSSIHVDHKNGNPFDNRRENLRICSNAQNSMNRAAARGSKSGHPGVYFIQSTGHWRALIVPNGVRISLGCYATRDEAIAARQQAEREHYGEFAFSNRLQPSSLN
jgi:hypothetical protein